MHQRVNTKCRHMTVMYSLTQILQDRVLRATQSCSNFTLATRNPPMRTAAGCLALSVYYLKVIQHQHKSPDSRLRGKARKVEGKDASQHIRIQGGYITMTFILFMQVSIGISVSSDRGYREDSELLTQSFPPLLYIYM